MKKCQICKAERLALLTETLCFACWEMQLRDGAELPGMNAERARRQKTNSDLGMTNRTGYYAEYYRKNAQRIKSSRAK